MASDELILDRYELLGTAGSGGFGTVRIAWDPRIQRKVAIKTIQLTELDAFRAALPGAQAVAKKPSERRSASAVRAQGAPLQPEGPEDGNGPAGEAGHDPLSTPTAERWHGVLPWDDFLAEDEAEAAERGAPENPEGAAALEGVVPDEGGAGAASERPESGVEVPSDGPGAPEAEPVTTLAHLPGLDEARTAAKLTDPHIVAVYDFEVRDRTAYLIMEYVEGITLTTLLRDYADFLTLDMVAGVFDAVAAALMAAHRASVLHLDIKPDNIIINVEGEAKVTDFGLATLADASGLGTTGGGTIGYMPLEQMRRERLDARTDEWSLAAVAYEMLTGDNPFRVRTLAEAEGAIENAELVLPSLCWDDVDEQIDDVVFYALDPDREERYASVKDFAEEMDKFLGDPVQGAKQLALVVEDALGDEDEVGEEAEGRIPEGEPPRLEKKRRGLRGLFGRAPERPEREQRAGWRGRGRRRERFRAEAAADGTGPAPARRSRSGSVAAGRPERVPLAQRVPEKAAVVLGRVYSAAASGAVAGLALANIGALVSLLGGASWYAVAAGALVVAVVGAFVPACGALVSLCLLGAVIMSCGHPVVGAALAAAAALWFYVIGREGAANANVMLSLPVLGSIGAGSAVPFAGGMSLGIVQALVTVGASALVAIVFASFGSGTLLWWDAPAHWDFARVDITANATALVTQASTWATAAGWVGAACALSALRRFGSRWGKVLGVAAACALVLVGSLVFSLPTPQLFITVIIAASVLLAAC